MSSKTLDKISFWALFLVIVLLPVFFIPFLGITVESSKTLLLVLGVAFSVVFWSAARFSEGKLVIPKSPVNLVGLGFVFVFFIASFFSEAKEVSFFGTMIDMGTFWFVFIAYLTMLFSSLIFDKKEKAQKVIFAFIIASIVSIIFQFLKIVFLSLETPIDISFGALDTVKTSNLIGSWNNLGIFSVILVFFSLFSFEFFKFDKEWKKFLMISSAVIGILMIVLVNFALVWKILGVLALIILAYKVAVSNFDEGKREFPIFSFSIVLVSLMFLMAPNMFGSPIAQKLGVQYLEIGPTFNGTLVVNKGVFSSGFSNLLFGIGPNNFDQAWQLYRSQEINLGQFWDLSFGFGFGILQTFLVTIGILGGLAWLCLLGFLFYYGIKFFIKFLNKEEAKESIVFLLASLFLFFISFFYSFGSVLFLLAFAFAGIFIGLSSRLKENSVFEFNLFNDPRKSVFSVIFLVLLMLGGAALSFKFLERFSGVFYLGQANKAGDIEILVDKTARASVINPNDLYYRTNAQAHLLRLNSLLSKEGELTEEDKAKISDSRDKMVSYSLSAIQYNPKNYVNHLALARIYSTLASYQVEDAGEQSIKAYEAAFLLSPKNPGILNEIGEVYFIQKKYVEAVDQAKKAVDLKPNYTNALSLISRSYKELGNKEEAIKYAEEILSFMGQDPVVINYLNDLKGISSSSNTVEVPKVEENNNPTDNVENSEIEE